MSTWHFILGGLLACIWLSRLIDTGRGMSHLTNIARPEWDHRRDRAGHSRVSIIVPARNEERALGQALSRLLALDYSDYEVIAVNDRSCDRTREILEQALRTAPGRVRIIQIEELPPRWMGKTYAMWRAAGEASGEWLLFTDADVMFRPDCLRRALAYAERERADHLVLFPRLIMKSPGEKMMMALFQLMFVFGHRPWKVADPKAKDHMGVGAFNLVRRSVYQAVGTYEALRFEVLDDMKLGKLIKNAGFRQRNVIGGDLVEIRWAQGARGIVRNLAKNFFAVLSYQCWRAIGFSMVAAVLNLLPFTGTLCAPGLARVPYAISLAAIFALYLGMSRYSDVRPWYFLLHPASTLLFIYTVLRSMLLTLWRGGVEWRGTFYALEELRRSLA
jgi:glycosyltransferase involved in cell wall biosynthesis